MLLQIKYFVESSTSIGDVESDFLDNLGDSINNGFIQHGDFIFGIIIGGIIIGIIYKLVIIPGIKKPYNTIIKDRDETIKLLKDLARDKVEKMEVNKKDKPLFRKIMAFFS